MKKALNLLIQGFIAIRKGLEPSTSCVTGRRSNQLNYRTNKRAANIRVISLDSQHPNQKNEGHEINRDPLIGMVMGYKFLGAQFFGNGGYHFLAFGLYCTSKPSDKISVPVDQKFLKIPLDISGKVRILQ